MTDPSHRCPSCAAAASGNFCQACGAVLTQERASCQQCRAVLTPGAKYCHRCGRSLAGAGAGASIPVPWLVAGAVTVVLVVSIALKAGGGIDFIRPDMANVGNPTSGSTPAARPPDISSMSPRERFDRLYGRVMEAGARQDSATVVQFTPMALGAYDQLPAPDDQARFRAAMIRVQVGDVEGALALADTLTATRATHLLGLVVRGAAAGVEGDRELLDRVYGTYLEHYETEIASDLPVYQAEKPILEGFRQAALSGATD